MKMMLLVGGVLAALAAPAVSAVSAVPASGRVLIVDEQTRLAPDRHPPCFHLLLRQADEPWLRSLLQGGRDG